jgi:DNA-binding response OmpR family regulator
MPESSAINVVALDLNARPYPAAIVEELHRTRLDIADLGRLVRHEHFVAGSAWSTAGDGAVHYRVSVQRPVSCEFTLRFTAELVPLLTEVVRRGGMVLCTTKSGHAPNQELLVFLEAAGALARILRSATGGAVAPLGACTLLVVSDDHEYASLLPFLFRKVELTTRISGGGGALIAIEEQQPDIVLVDVRRGALGSGAMELFASMRRRTPVPMLALVDLGDEKQAVGALENGVDDVVYASSGGPELLGRMLLHLLRKGTLDASASVVLPPTVGRVEAGPLVLSVLDRALWNGFRWHRITAPQVRLILPLMESPGIFVPLGDLMSQVQDAAAPSPATLVSVVTFLQSILAGCVDPFDTCRLEITDSGVRLVLPDRSE